MSEDFRRAAHWDQRYLSGDTPWDSGLVERELVRWLPGGSNHSGRAFEFGCGVGTNAVYLAQRGFDVAAVDGSQQALERANALANSNGVRVQFFAADVCRLETIRSGFDPSFQQSFSILFDRGCYHCVRKTNLAGFLEVLDWLAAPNARLLMLCGNANDKSEHGPPRVTEDEVRQELGSLFDIHSIVPFRFEDRGGIEGPLGWSCSMSRRAH